MNHECLAASCKTTVSPSMLFCPPHWYMVPEPIRNAVWASWAGGAGQGTLAHCQAIRLAVGAVDRKLAEAGR